MTEEYYAFRRRRQPTLVHIQTQLTWQVAKDPATGRYLGVCDPLNLNAVGDTWLEFQECTNEAMQLLFRHLYEEGELEAFLRSRGWRQLDTPPPRRTIQFDVPYAIEQVERYEELLA